MKEFNFNTLRDLPVPEQWIENALAIPETEEQKPAAVPFWRKPRFIAMAATLVLVSALSIALFLSMGKPPIAVKSGSEPYATEIVWSTDEYGATVATEVVVVPDGHDDQGGTSPTEPKSALARIMERLFGTDDNTSPTTASGSGRGRINPTTKTSPTEKGGTTTKPGSTEGGKPSITPTEAADDPEPLKDPTESPAPRPTTAPTELSWEEPPTVAPEDPWWNDPTEPPGTYYISASIPWDEHSPRDHNVFCRLETYDGEIIGEGGLFDSNRLMAWLGSDRQKMIYSYQFKNNITIPDELKGEYVNYYIYDIEGNILRSGTCLL